LAVKDGAYYAVAGGTTVVGGPSEAGPPPDSEVTAVGGSGGTVALGDRTGGVWRWVGGAWSRAQGPSTEPVRSVATFGDFVAWSDGGAVYAGGRTWPVLARALATDGSSVFATTADGRVMRMRGDTVETAFAGHTGTVDAVAVSPDGSTVASGGDDRTIEIWDKRTGNVLHTLVGHTDRVLDIAFSPDGTRLVSVGEDDRMIIWDVAANAMVGSPIPSPSGGRIDAVAWEGANTILSAGPGVFRWRIGIDDLVAADCRLASTRALTDAERTQFLDAATPQDPCP
jgi:WD40 repeat protein